MSGTRTVTPELQRRIRHARAAYGRCDGAKRMDVELDAARRKRAPEPSMSEPRGLRAKRGRE